MSWTTKAKRADLKRATKKRTNRKKQLLMYIKELQYKRDDYQISLDFFRNAPEQNDITYFVTKFLMKQLHDVNGVINTLMLIAQ